MPQMKERRHHIRKVGDGLVVLIDDQVYPVLDISVSGMSFQASHVAVGDRIKLKIAQLTNMKACIDGELTVRAVNGTVARGEFFATMPLMRYIISHIGNVTGGEPSHFK